MSKTKLLGILHWILGIIFIYNGFHYPQYNVTRFCIIAGVSFLAGFLWFKLNDKEDSNETEN